MKRSFLWRLIQNLLFLSGAVQQSPTMAQNLVSKAAIEGRGRCHLTFFEKKKIPYILVTSQTGYVDVLNRTIFELKRLNSVYSGFFKPKEATPVPGGTFNFYAFTISDGCVLTGQKGRFILFDASDLTKPQQYIIADEESAEYDNPVWIGRDIIVSKIRSHGNEIVHFKLKSEEDFGSWEEMIISKADSLKDKMTTKMILYKNVWDTFDAIFAISQESSLILIWPETEAGEPGDWRKPEELKAREIRKFSKLKVIKLADINSDGRLDVVFAAGQTWTISVFEVPNSTDFRDPSKYKLHEMISYSGDSSSGICPNIVRTFIPSHNYKGKLWVLSGGYYCKMALYSVPNDQYSTNWTYKNYEIPGSHGGSTVYSGLEAVDVDQDGFVELFVAFETGSSITAFSFKEKFIKKHAATTKSRRRATESRGHDVCISLTLVVTLQTVIHFRLFYLRSFCNDIARIVL